MKIFTIIGMIVTPLITLVLGLIAHDTIYKHSKFYRIFIDWLQMPYLVFYHIPRMNEDEIENTVKWIGNSKYLHTKRWKVALWAINRRIKFLKKSE